MRISANVGAAINEARGRTGIGRTRGMGIGRIISESERGK